MQSSREETAADAVLDKRRLQAMGVLLPIRLHALSFLPGRHPLGRAGDGMRYLRTRPFEPGHDSPRDIDKFSPPDEDWVDEWESEALAVIRLCGDMSHSMAFAPTAAVRNLTLLQLTYSLWRSCDQVRITLFNAEASEELLEPNLKSQLERVVAALGTGPAGARRSALELLGSLAASPRSVREDLLFVISDFRSVTVEDPVAVQRQWHDVVRRLPCDVVPVLISFELPREQRGSVKLRDPESGRQRLTLLTPSRIDRINALERTRIESLEKLFRSLGLGYITVRRERDVYPSLAWLARMRRGRGA